MRTTPRQVLWISAALLAAATAAFAGDTGARQDGNWSDLSIWTAGAVPGSSDNAFIGSTYPGGSAATAAVTLDADQSAATLSLGYGPGSNGTLDLGNHNLTLGGWLYVGLAGGSGTVNRGTGSLTANALGLDSGNAFFFAAPDAVSRLMLDNKSQATTAGAGNVTGQVELFGVSKLTLGADMSLSGIFNAGDDGLTFDMKGHALSASGVDLGYDGTIALLNRGPLTATYLYVGHQTLDLGPTDSVQTYYLNKGTSTVTGAVTGGVILHGGSRLTLGADMSLSSQFSADDKGLTVDMQGHALSAYSVHLGYTYAAPALVNRGRITATSLYVGNQAFDLGPSDSVQNYYLHKATTTLNSSVSYLELSNASSATTTATGGVTGSVYLHGGPSGGSRLTLGADMSLIGDLRAEDASTIDAAHHRLTAFWINLGYLGSTPVSLINSGPVQAYELHLRRGSTATLHPGDVVNRHIFLFDASTLTVFQAKGELTGLTLNGTDSLSLSLHDTSTLALILADNTQPSWIFRWQDPAGATWESTLLTLINSGKILVTAPNGYSLFDQGGYTYIGSQVPEPGALVGLLGLGGTGLAIYLSRRRRRS